MLVLLDPTLRVKHDAIGSTAHAHPGPNSRRPTCRPESPAVLTLPAPRPARDVTSQKQQKQQQLRQWHLRQQQQVTRRGGQEVECASPEVEMANPTAETAEVGEIGFAADCSVTPAHASRQPRPVAQNEPHLASGACGGVRHNVGGHGPSPPMLAHRAVATAKEGGGSLAVVPGRGLRRLLTLACVLLVCFALAGGQLNQLKRRTAVAPATRAVMPRQITPLTPLLARRAGVAGGGGVPDAGGGAEPKVRIPPGGGRGGHAWRRDSMGAEALGLPTGTVPVAARESRHWRQRRAKHFKQLNNSY